MEKELRKNIDFKVLGRKDGQLLIDNFIDGEAQLWGKTRNRQVRLIHYGNSVYEMLNHASKEDFGFFGVLDLRPLRA